MWQKAFGILLVDGTFVVGVFGLPEEIKRKKKEKRNPHRVSCKLFTEYRKDQLFTYDS